MLSDTLLLRAINRLESSSFNYFGSSIQYPPFRCCSKGTSVISIEPKQRVKFFAYRLKREGLSTSPCLFPTPTLQAHSPTTHKRDSIVMMEYQKLHTVDKFTRQHFLGRTLLLVFSVSLFSLLLSYSSAFSCFLHSFNLYYNTFLFSLVTHTLERKYLFLICNGIVAFLASYSGFDNSPPGSGVNAWFLKRNEDGGSSASELSDMKPLVAAMGSQGQDALVVEEDPDQQQENESFHLQELERENQALILEDKEAEEETRSLIPKAAEEEEEVKENEDPASTEELNKKFEDFIRRIKEELRVEAQHQLITV